MDIKVEKENSVEEDITVIKYSNRRIFIVAEGFSQKM